MGASPETGLWVLYRPARVQATGRGAVKALPMGPPASWQPHCCGSRRQTPPPPSSCKQRAEEGRVRQPHPLMAHTGLGQVRAHPRPLPASSLRGSLLPWGLVRKLLRGSPQDHWGPLGQAGTVSVPTGRWPHSGPTPFAALRCLGPEPSALSAQEAGRGLPISPSVWTWGHVYIYVTCVCVGR